MTGQRQPHDPGSTGPPIRYTRTSDGVSIAYYSLGNGPPLIAMPANLCQTIEYDWKISNMRAAAEASARAFTYVKYDPRGSGLSDRQINEFSPDAMALDVEAVANAVAADEFRLFAPGPLGMAGIAFAAHHPERVSCLVLWSSAADGRDTIVGPLLQLEDIATTDWRLASEAIIRAVDNWDNPDLAHEYAALMRASVEPATYQRYQRAMHDWDVSGLLEHVACPTLVIHPRANPYHPATRARRVAAGIPGARLALVDTSSVLMPGTEVLRISGRFLLGLDRGDHVEHGRELPEGTTVILFADIADSTAITERIGDAAFRDCARRLDARLRGVVSSRGGMVIEGRLLGDGIMAVFPSASRAIEAALDCVGACEGGELRLHIGLHAGDVIHEGNNVYGGAVNMAARIAAAAAPGEVLVSRTIRDLARTSAPADFAAGGTHELKGIEEPQELFVARSRS